MQSCDAWSSQSQQKQTILVAVLNQIHARLQSSADACQAGLDQLRHWQQRADAAEQQHELSRHLQEAERQLALCRQAAKEATEEVKRVFQEQDAILRHHAADAALPAGLAWQFKSQVAQNSPESASHILSQPSTASRSSSEAPFWPEASSSDTSADEAMSSDNEQMLETPFKQAYGSHSWPAVVTPQTVNPKKGVRGRKRDTDKGRRTFSSTMQGLGQERQGQVWRPEGGPSSSTGPSSTRQVTTALSAACALHHLFNPLLNALPIATCHVPDKLKTTLHTT